MEVKEALKGTYPVNEINLENMLDILCFVAGEERTGLTVTEPCLVALPDDATVGTVRSETTRRTFCALGSVIEQTFVMTMQKVMCNFCHIDNIDREPHLMDPSVQVTICRQKILKILLREAIWREFPITRGLPLALNKNWLLTMRRPDFNKAQKRQTAKSEDSNSLLPQILQALQNNLPEIEDNALKQDPGIGEEVICVLSDERLKGLFSILEHEQRRVLSSPVFKSSAILNLDDHKALRHWIESLGEQRQRKAIMTLEKSRRRTVVLRELFWRCIYDMLPECADKGLGIRKDWKIVTLKPNDPEGLGCHGGETLFMALPAMFLGGVHPMGPMGSHGDSRRN